MVFEVPLLVQVVVESRLAAHELSAATFNHLRINVQTFDLPLHQIRQWIMGMLRNDINEKRALDHAQVPAVKSEICNFAGGFMWCTTTTIDATLCFEVLPITAEPPLLELRGTPVVASAKFERLPARVWW